MNLEQTWRWYGPDDPISLREIRQTGATGIVTALHHIPNGEIWPQSEIEERKDEIEATGLRWSVVESIPVHEDIKRASGDYLEYIRNYKQSIRNLANCGVKVVCYNFMPILDWTRTDLKYPFGDGSTALRFDEVEFCVFDLYILKRKNAAREYEAPLKKRAEFFFNKMSSAEIEYLTDTIIAGLPGSEEGYSLQRFRDHLTTYDKIDDLTLRKNLYHFLEEIIPIAEKTGVKMAIHPDDPPFSLFGLPRVVSTEADAKQLVEAVKSPSNGLTFCTGSYGVRPDNDLSGMVDRLGSHIHFIHLRNVQREEFRTFHEANHLEGSVDMKAVMSALVREQSRRKEVGRVDINIPMRPDHGHCMLSDFDRRSNPGYSLIGRMRGLAELRGLEMGVRE